MVVLSSRLLRALPHTSFHPVQLFSVSAASSACVSTQHNVGKAMRNHCLSPNFAAALYFHCALAIPTEALHTCRGYAELGVCKRTSTGARDEESCRRSAFWFRRECDAQVSCTLTRKREGIGRCFSGETSSIIGDRRAGEEGNGIMALAVERIDEKQRRRLVLYSKPGCCLCDGLKEKLHLVFMMGGEDRVSDAVELEVRDITTNKEWEQAYQYEIPVLALLQEDNSEVVLPRFSPRLTIEQLQKKLVAALS